MPTAIGFEGVSLPGGTNRPKNENYCLRHQGRRGQTTLAANLGGVIAGPGKRVLLIDADPQPSLTSYYRLAAGGHDSGLTNLLAGELSPAPRRISVENLDIIVSDDPSGSLEARLSHASDGRFRMLDRLQVIQGNDITIIDTQGSTGTLVESAVLAADICLSPLPLELLSDQDFCAAQPIW